jgi:hypothetical protein
MRGGGNRFTGNGTETFATAGAADREARSRELVRVIGPRSRSLAT